MVKKLLVVLFLLVLISCGQDDKLEKQIAEIPVEVKFNRFDQKFAEASAEDLPELKKEFPFLFPVQFSDSVWIDKMSDTIQLELNREVAKEFHDLEGLEQEFHLLFQHILYYFPDTEIPEIITLTSDVDYRNKAVWTEDFLLISLDTYLGKGHYFYVGIQEYLKKNFEREQIIPDVASAFAETVVPRPETRIFLDHMVYYGKILYLKEVLIPFKEDFEKIGYTPEELDWAQGNEDQIWRYFVERELLFDSDSELQTRFLFPGPFSKFHLQLDHESPARLGQYIGWQIVRQYMEEAEVGVGQLLKTDAETIFNKSNYKPRNNG